jgi:hypothetical protein
MNQVLNPFLSSQGCNGTQNPLRIHLILINAAAATWRGYLVYIAEQVRKLVSTLHSAFPTSLTLGSLIRLRLPTWRRRIYTSLSEMSANTFMS